MDFLKKLFELIQSRKFLGSAATIWAAWEIFEKAPKTAESYLVFLGAVVAVAINWVREQGKIDAIKAANGG